MCRLNKKTAFTLVETLISIMLLVIVMSSSTVFFNFSSELESSNEHRRIAANKAGITLEKLKVAGYLSPQLISSVDPNVPIGSSGLMGAQTVTVGLPVNGYKKVTVNLSWTEAGTGKAENVNAITFMSP